MKPIKDFEDYLITEDGIVYNSKGIALSSKPHPKGYLVARLVKNKKRYHLLIHRLVALTYIDNPLNYPQVNHKDGNKQNNHISNLEWCTNKQNIQHAIDNGLANYSENGKQRAIKMRSRNLTCWE